jgi:6-phosphofructokinase 1
MSEEKHLAVLTSGGDAPGMNAAIRAVVRFAIHLGFRCSGVIRGYQGLIDDNIIPLDLRSVANIIQRGGTMLKTARCEAFFHEDGRAKAAATLERHGIGYLVVIGGDGSFRGAWKLNQEHGIKVTGIPGTIDNDILGTDYTIGYDTALNTALESVDRIRDTAASHERLFLIEVMGRKTGFIALEVGIAAGAEMVLTSENPQSMEAVCRRLLDGQKRGKTSSIVVVGEAEREGHVFELARELRERCGMDYRVTVLGHTQRGGSPSARDRVLASRLGAAAVEAIAEGETNLMVGEVSGRIVRVPFEEVVKGRKSADMTLFNLVDILSL